jgi:hypothetical protein
MGLEACCGEALNYHLKTLRFYWFYIYIALPSKSGSSPPKTVRLPSKIPECYPKH